MHTLQHDQLHSHVILLVGVGANMSSVLCIVKVALVVLFPLALGVVGRNDHGINSGKPNIVILFADDVSLNKSFCVWSFFDRHRP